MSDRKWPVSVMGTRWLTYCPHDGWDEHDTPEDAESAFSATFEYLSYNARHDGEWFDDADSAAWGVWIPIDRLAFVACGDDDDDDDRVVVDGVVQRVEPDAAALEFCASFADVVSRERIAELEAEVARLRRLLAVERGDESAAPRGWRCEGRWWSNRRYHVDSDKIGGNGRFWFFREPSAVRRDGAAPAYDTALEAMEAADRAAQEVSDV